MPNYDSMSRDELVVALEKAGHELRGLQALRESEVFYRELFESIIDPYYRADMNGVLVLCSPSAARLLGYDKAEDLVGINVAQAFYADPMERDCFVKTLRERGKISGYRVALRAKDGRAITVEVNSRVVTSGEGEPLYIEGVFRDVTFRVEAEEKLRVSELFYRSLFENTGAATVLFDSNGVIEKCNSKFAALAGLPHDAIIGKYRWTDFVDQADLKRMWAYHEQRVKEGADPPKEYTFAFVSHCGQKSFVQVSVDVVEESESRTASLVDITKLKQIEADLYTAKNEFESIFDNSQVGIMLLREGRRFSRGNRRLADILGYESPEEMANISMREIHLSEREFLEYGKKYYNALAQNDQIHIEYQLKRKDGTPVWCSLSGKALDPSDLDKGVIWIVDDIAERKRTELALLNARNYIRNIIDSMPSILVGVDVAGCVTQWNAAACQATGLTPDSAVGKAVNEVLPWLGTRVDSLREDMQSRGPRMLNALPVVMEGERRYQDVTIYSLGDAKEHGAVLIIEDVTERVHMEEILVQNEKMMSVGGLAAGMAHEINNPLSGILGAVQNIFNRISPDNSANLKLGNELGVDVSGVHAYMEQRGILRFLEGIRESGIRAARIVSTMLNFSRASSKDKELHDLRDLLEASVELASKDYNLKTKYDFKGITIIRDYASDLPKVAVIASEIEQVFLNILTNAAQALSARMQTPKDATITLRLLREEEAVRVELQDNGPGMDANRRKRIFEPFYTTKAPGEGTGLGLSVSYFIITRNHGGTLTAESVAGKGTTFVVRLPVG